MAENTKATQTDLFPCQCDRQRNPGNQETSWPVRPEPHYPPIHPGYHGYPPSYFNPPVQQQQWPHSRASQFMPPHVKYRLHGYQAPPQGHQGPQGGYHGYPPPPGGPPPARDPNGRKICNIEVKFRPDDVLVATFPRSGTTWTIEIVRQLHLMHLNNPSHPLNSDRNKGGMFLTPQVTKEMVEAMESPRILKTHSYFSDLNFDDTFNNCKIIHVIRDPKDVYCSIYEHSKQMHFQRPQGSEVDEFQDFLEGFIKENRYQGPGPANWTLFTREYLENSRNLNILHIKYEDLKQAPEATIYKVALFLGYNQITASQITQIKDFTSYSKMKITHSNVVHDKTQGSCGAYKKKLSDANISDINKNIANFLSETDDKGLGIAMYCTRAN